jgi:hypothetical protein
VEPLFVHAIIRSKTGNGTQRCLRKFNAAREPDFSSSPISSRSILNMKDTNTLRTLDFDFYFQDVTFLKYCLHSLIGVFSRAVCAAIDRFIFNEIMRTNNKPMSSHNCQSDLIHRTTATINKYVVK